MAPLPPPLPDPRRERRLAKRAVASGQRLAIDDAKRRLKEALSTSLTAVGELFQLWDLDGSGDIDRDEFRQAIAALKVPDVPLVAIEELFEDFDRDGSGAITYHEYLRYALRDALGRSSTRVMDVFRSFDKDESGEVNFDEFRRAIATLGYDVPYESLVEIFHEMDTDGSGTLSGLAHAVHTHSLHCTLDHHELHHQLRIGSAQVLPRPLRVGYRGKIEPKARNFYPLRGTFHEQYLATLYGTHVPRDGAHDQLKQPGAGLMSKDAASASTGGGGGGASTSDPKSSPTATAQRSMLDSFLPPVIAPPRHRLSYDDSSNGMAATAPLPRPPPVSVPALGGGGPGSGGPGGGGPGGGGHGGVAVSASSAQLPHRPQQASRAMSRAGAPAAPRPLTVPAGHGAPPATPPWSFRPGRREQLVQPSTATATAPLQGGVDGEGSREQTPMTHAMTPTMRKSAMTPATLAEPPRTAGAAGMRGGGGAPTRRLGTAPPPPATAFARSGGLGGAASAAFGHAFGHAFGPARTRARYASVKPGGGAMPPEPWQVHRALLLDRGGTPISSGSFTVFDEKRRRTIQDEKSASAARRHAEWHEVGRY